MSATPNSLFSLSLTDLSIHVSEAVRWGDMDAYQHMNNTVFFRLFEQARMAYFEAINFTDPKSNEGVGPILAHTECYFLRPLAYPQVVTVGTRVHSVRSDRFDMDYGIFTQDDTPVLAAAGTGKVVSFNYDKGIKQAIPDVIAGRINALEDRVGATD